jgi:hypothetical protein
MWQPRLKWGIAFALAFVVAACEECEDGPTDSEHIEFDVELFNTGNEQVHIFALDETFPCCQVTGHGSRVVHITNVSPGTSIQFSVGRNGEILETQFCPADDGVKKDVVWQPLFSDPLICSDGWGGAPAAPRR